MRIPLHTHIYASDASSHSHLSAKSHTWTPVNSGFKRFFALKIAKFSLKSAERAATRAWQTNSEPGRRHGRKYSHFGAAGCPERRAARRRGDPHGRPGLTSKNWTGLTLTLTPPNGSHTHISHPGPPLPPCRMAPSSCQHLDLPERPEMLDTLLFSIKRDARNLAGRAQKLPPARLLLPSGWYDRAKLRSSWRIIATVLASRETDSRFSAYAAT